TVASPPVPNAPARRLLPAGITGVLEGIIEFRTVALTALDGEPLAASTLDAASALRTCGVDHGGLRGGEGDAPRPGHGLGGGDPSCLLPFGTLRPPVAPVKRRIPLGGREPL